MDMNEWAKREIEIAQKRERGNAPDGEWDYGCACYDSAFKAFQSLCEDGHSGMSIGFTKNILNRLIDGKPLTPIEDTEDVWNLCDYGENHEYTQYQCKRMSALFKKVFPDGRIEYSSVDQCYGRDINTGSTYTSGLVSRVIRELYPITMPYIPGDIIEVATEDFLTDRKNGDFDTYGIYYAVVNGEKVEINRFFAEPQDYPGEKEVFSGWVEISSDIFEMRKEKADILRVQTKKENCERYCQLFDTCQKKEKYQHNRTYCDDFIHINDKPVEVENDD